MARIHKKISQQLANWISYVNVFNTFAQSHSIKCASAKSCVHYNNVCRWCKNIPLLSCLILKDWSHWSTSSTKWHPPSKRSLTTLWTTARQSSWLTTWSSCVRSRTWATTCVCSWPPLSRRFPPACRCWNYSRGVVPIKHKLWWHCSLVLLLQVWTVELEVSVRAHQQQVWRNAGQVFSGNWKSPEGQWSYIWRKQLTISY